jgi:cobalt/nickel transport system ATP-binding protein
MVSSMILQVKNLSFQYLESQHVVLDKTNFQLDENEKVALIGENGCGKSTFFSILMGLKKDYRGELFIFGKELLTEKDFQWMRKKVGLLFQDSDDQLFSPTVLEDVAFGVLNQGKSIEDATELSLSILAELGIQNLSNQITHHLSGGQKKLVALATILVMQPQILFLDEPATALDHKSREQLIRILNDLKQSMVIISHDMNFLDQVTKKNYQLHQGKIQLC